ncbi:hypothetical protein AYJ57_13155 [Salipiger sp. CCB-MM3]|uniref:NAD-dependent epimerase/dehydratase family protein n=1 Tax=Salipiger sp. CCB-MM3 TaxID=1792508 RepID=UPI00080A9CD8|nr:NAD-dependent epimerase/dehydratase [Salipiger sp. CCB-MM3]ANT61234.1 hypothetical protein AYJ57_13155 [Salipiger sp. CCB-MM3]
MARVLVTGATGLIGRAAVAALAAQGHQLWAMSRRGSALPGATPVACDLTDPTARKHAVAHAEADTLLHLAWLTGPARWHGAENLDWVRHSLGLVQDFAAIGGRRVVAAGSCAEYDWSAGTFSEATPLRPATAYGAAKAATGLALCGAAPALGLSLAWARMFFVFGPGEPRGRLFGDLIQGLAAGETVACTDGRQRRDFLHVDDLGRALSLLCDAEDLTGAVNVGHGDPVEVRQLIGELARQLHAENRVLLGARPRAAGDPDLLAADVTRLRAALGFRPRLSWPEAVTAVLRAEEVL